MLLMCAFWMRLYWRASCAFLSWIVPAALEIWILFRGVIVFRYDVFLCLDGKQLWMLLPCCWPRMNRSYWCSSVKGSLNIDFDQQYSYYCHADGAIISFGVHFKTDQMKLLFDEIEQEGSSRVALLQGQELFDRLGCILALKRVLYRLVRMCPLSDLC